ncbi:membrane fusion protein, multidrug efflux system [Rhizobiales bacterium GAS188]|nr:membrane fusion protein, multidrug efflux system [Rhizobiales bacterium GAS188]
MRNEETSDASFRAAEGEVVAANTNLGGTSGAAAPPEADLVPAQPPSGGKRRSILGIISSVLSAAVVVGAFGFLLASGFAGRFSSLAQDGGVKSSSAAAASSGSGQAAPVQVASVTPPAEQPPAVQAVPVLVSVSEKRPAPITADAVGRVESIASITVRTRVDGQIAKVLFQDGQAVNQGDPLFELDARQIDAQIRQAEAVVAKDRAQIVQTQRDVVRNDTLAKTNAGSVLNLQNAQTAEALAEASLAADQAALDNLRVQRSYYVITSPVTGRAGIGIQREGSAIRTGDSSGTLVTVNQIKPIYVNFALPQKLFASLQSTAGRGGAKVIATVQGSALSSTGRVVAVDNSADSTSGNIGVRAVFGNDNEGLWPGLLCSVSVTLGRDENAVIIARDAVQSSQNGNIVFVVEHGAAKVKAVTVDRFEGATAIISSGLSGGETVVTDGQLRLTDGTPVSTQPDKRRRGDPS